MTPCRCAAVGPIAQSVEQRTFNPLGLFYAPEQIHLRTTANPYFTLRLAPKPLNRCPVMTRYYTLPPIVFGTGLVQKRTHICHRALVILLQFSLNTNIIQS